VDVWADQVALFVTRMPVGRSCASSLKSQLFMLEIKSPLLITSFCAQSTLHCSANPRLARGWRIVNRRRTGEIGAMHQASRLSPFQLCTQERSLPNLQSSPLFTSDCPIARCACDFVTLQQKEPQARPLSLGCSISHRTTFHPPSPAFSRIQHFRLHASIIGLLHDLTGSSQLGDIV